MRRSTRLAACIAGVLTLAHPALASDVSFTWQGRLLDSLGEPISSPTDVTVTLQNASETAVWSKEFGAVSVQDGYAALQITGVDDFTRDIDSVDFSVPLYLSLTVGTGPMDPPQLLGSVPRSASAARGGGANAVLVSANAQLSPGDIAIVTGVAQVDLTLPTTCDVGDRIEVVGDSSTGWQLLLPAGVAFTDVRGTNNSLPIASESGTDSLEILCVEDDVRWRLLDSSNPNLLTTCSAPNTVLTTPGSNSLTVPDGCTVAVVTAWGGAGGGGGSYQTSSGSYGTPSGGTGGAGGYAAATLSVTPGESLGALLGGGGGPGVSTNQGGSGGVGGGGDGGDGYCGGGGGGRTELTRSGVALIVAAGGGGAGGNNPRDGGPNDYGQGGAGGGTTGEVGERGQNATGGGAGTSSGGGAGGPGNGNGGNGSLWTGGVGGTTNWGGGGGGGGGYYGGGGGGSSSAQGRGAGGGGGSSYANGTSAVLLGGSGATPPQTTSNPYLPGTAVGGTGGASTGVAGGDGLLVIDWQ